MIQVLRHWRPVLAAASALFILALLDFLLPRGSWYADHPMTASAISAVIGFVAAGLFLEGWLKDREARRLEGISAVAYRSLAQFANDAGRDLLGPLYGADLFALGIPGSTQASVAADRSRLARHGHAASFEQTTGSWNGDRDTLVAVLSDLLEDPGYVRSTFRRTAVMRRRLQEVTALWAPVMLTARQYADDLARMRQLTDAMELLQEHLRLSGLIALEAGPRWEPSAPWKEAVQQQFWRTIDAYESIRDEFGDLAKLPSDALVRRRPAPQSS